jgi:ubiquinone/menaquinone biosynthesis C-methylase UbiE
MLRRRHDPEVMDDSSIQDERMDNALGELRRVNMFLGGRTTTQKGLRLVRKELSLDHPLSVLDIGAGGADVFDGSVQSLNITVLDRNPRVCEYLKRHVPYTVICGDVLHLSFRDRSFDVVHASLFLHHLHEKEIRQVLSSCLRISRHGVIINDLRRSIFAYAGIKVLTTLFSKSSMVKHDGPLSVLRGFSRNELRTLLAACGITKYSLQRTWAFRWLVVASRS